MKHIYLRLIVVLAALSSLLLLSGCSSSSGESTSNEQNITWNNLTTNTRQVYDETDIMTAPDGQGGTMTVSQNLTRTITVLGQETFNYDPKAIKVEVESVYEGTTTYHQYQYFKAVSGGIALLGEKTVNENGALLSQTIYNPPLELPGSVAVGDTFSWSAVARDPSSSQSVSMKATFNVLAYEAVTVPAGTYNAFKIAQITDTAGMTVTTTTWYAKGVGIVKQISHSSIVSQTIDVTIELKSIE